MSRKDDYKKSVKGKMGGLDVVSTNPNSEFVINKAGAKVYIDLSKHNELEIPILANEHESGKVYEVLSVGMMPPGIAIATVKVGDLPVA
jgi:phosphoribosylcarboxyaminoimidazole (NCAIR) mutase